MTTRPDSSGDDPATPSLSALVFDAPEAITIGRMTLTERAVRLAARAGLSPLRVWGQAPMPPAAAAALRADGIVYTPVLAPRRPLDSVPEGEAAIVIAPDALFEAGALTDLAVASAHEAPDTVVAVRDGGTPLLLVVPPTARPHAADASFDALARALQARGARRDLALPSRFVRGVSDQASARELTLAYLRHTNGGSSESFFTKKIRRFSVPLSVRLAQLGMTPTQVTLGGLLLAVMAAWCLAEGHYALGVLGGGLYYASMVFDCSDGEVARLTVRDSAFGAWLETMVDYATYFLVLAGLTTASLSLPSGQWHGRAALVAFLGSVVVGVAATVLRRRVAAADPGQFDESSARALATAGPLHRFARWGRQWIKRSTIAHLILFLALIGQLPALLYLWAFGALLGTVTILAVAPFVSHRTTVAPVRIPRTGLGQRGG